MFSFTHLFVYISLNQINVVYLFRRISFSFISSYYHLISLSFHLIVISLSSHCHFIVISLSFHCHLTIISFYCHLILLSSHLVCHFISSFFYKMNSQNFAFVNVSDKKTAVKRVFVKMISIKIASIKIASVKKTSIKKVKQISDKKEINRVNIEIKKIAEKRIILSAEDEKISNFDDILLTWIKQSDWRNSTLSSVIWAFNIKSFFHSFDTRTDVTKQKFSMTSISYDEFTKSCRDMNDFLLSELTYFSRFFFTNVC